MQIQGYAPVFLFSSELVGASTFLAYAQVITLHIKFDKPQP